MNARPHLAEDGTNDNTGQIRFLTEGDVKTEWVPVTCKRREIIREGESLVFPQSSAFIFKSREVKGTGRIMSARNPGEYIPSIARYVALLAAVGSSRSGSRNSSDRHDDQIQQLKRAETPTAPCSL